MQQASYLDDIQYIVQSIDVNPEGRLYFQDQPFSGYDQPDASPETRLFNHLNNLLYSACYTRAGYGTDIGDSPVASPDNQPFIQSLRSANSSKELFDAGWMVEEIEQNGNILASKGGNRRHTFAGDFIREHFGHGPLQRGELINLRVIPELGAEPVQGEVFYFVFGNTLLEENNSSLVRFYFNIQPEGAAPLIGLVTSRLNDYCIPFQFKCLNRPDLYHRSDSAVLYVDKRYFSLVSNLLLEAFDHLKPWLNSEVPMFTKVLAQGIGFAENPFSIGESFGTSRCKIIAQAITNAWKTGIPKSEWSMFIQDAFARHFLQPDALYRNPNSRYPYQFPETQN